MITKYVAKYHVEASDRESTIDDYLPFECEFGSPHDIVEEVFKTLFRKKAKVTYELYEFVGAG